MLAQNFMTPAQLGLTENQHGALVQVLGMLDRGELVYTPMAAVAEGNFQNRPGLFNMNAWHRAQECGTIHCIGGTAELLGADDFHWIVQHNSALRNLFYPFSVPHRKWELITTAQAAAALRSYLTTGESNWVAAMREC